MKTRVLIIEDNYYKFFTTKQLIESQLKLDIQVVGCTSGKDVVASTTSIDPDLIMYSPEGGVIELISKLKRRNSNRRNTEIVLMQAGEFDDELARKVKEFVKLYPKNKVASAA